MRGLARNLEFSPEVYRQAAKEHAVAATALYSQGNFVLAAYVAGLSVECMLRAYQVRINPEFDARHDLLALYGNSRFRRIFPLGRAGDYSAMMGMIATLWSSAHRYRSERSLRALWKRMRFDRQVRKGDFLKELTRRMVSAAAELVTLGVQQWNV
jgi:hypothetical protein